MKSSSFDEGGGLNGQPSQATTEKSKRLDLLSAEKEEKNHRKSPNWLLRLVGAR